MATDQQATAAYRRLMPHLSPVLDPDEALSLDQAVAAGEPYEALGWLLSSIDQPGITIPRDAFLEAFDCLNDEDKEEYEHLLHSQHIAA